MTNNNRTAQEATAELEAVGYSVTPYPDKDAAAKLIVRKGDRTVTTLDVLPGNIIEGVALDYFLSEARYDLDHG